MDEISVLICDDSALMRNLVGRIIEGTDGLQIAGKAENGKILLEKIPILKPDVILLDIEMPVMTGVEFLKARKELHIDVPVIILSSIATQGAAVTMQCLELGASDFITKPGGTSVTLKISDVSSDIIERVASYGGAYASVHGKTIPSPDFFHNQIKLKEAERFVQQKKGDELAKTVVMKHSDFKQVQTLWSAPKKKEPAIITPLRDGGRIDVIALGISTGGPNALRTLFSKIDPLVKQPILVVQHMPAGFTKEFAESLNRICPLTVTEAMDGELLQRAHVYIAPGGWHMTVEMRALGKTISLNQDDPRNGHRPSVDVLFESVAKVYKNHALGVIMTGMGRDGAVQLAEMRKQGAWTLGQNQETCIVYGMPKVGFELGGVQKQVPLENMAAEISSLVREHESF